MKQQVKERTFKQHTRRRYNLHHKIRAKGHKLNAFDRTIYPLSNNSVSNKHIEILKQEYGYSVQLEIV